MHLTGIPASPGIAIGPVVLYQPEPLTIERTAIESSAAPIAWERVQQSMQQASEQIIALRDQVVRWSGPDEAAIFDAHLLIIEDDALRTEIRDRIYTHLLNPEAAVMDAFEVYRVQMLAIDDDYLRARAADLEDIALRIVNCLTGVDRAASLQVHTPCIIAARDLLPSDTAALDPSRILAFVTEQGGATAHTAILARQFNIPAVVGVNGLLATLQHNSARTLIVDGAHGDIITDPDSAIQADYAARKERLDHTWQDLLSVVSLPCETIDGKRVALGVNVGHPHEVARGIELGAGGVGLFRTEFLFLDRQTPPTEDEQVEAYRAAARSVPPDGHVIIRTLDIGGDKAIPYLPQIHEENPFLGVRGVRLCLSAQFRPLFLTQLRALLRAASDQPGIQIMLPMVNTLSEILAVRQMLFEAAEGLEDEGLHGRNALAQLRVGIMLETPAAALAADMLASECDFFSIGTNDLTQYVLAVDRMNGSVAQSYSYFAPAVLRALYAAITGAHSKGRTVGMCGEMAGDPRAVLLLLGIGLDEFSMTATSLPQVRRTIRSTLLAEAQKVMRHAFTLPYAEEVEQYLTEATARLAGNA